MSGTPPPSYEEAIASDHTIVDSAERENQTAENQQPQPINPPEEAPQAKPEQPTGQSDDVDDADEVPIQEMLQTAKPKKKKKSKKSKGKRGLVSTSSLPFDQRMADFAVERAYRVRGVLRRHSDDPR